MAKPFPIDIQEEYKQREREIKIKGDIKFPKQSTPLINLMPTYSGTYTYSNFTMEINNQHVKIYGTTSSSSINFPNYPSLTLGAGRYKLKMNITKNTNNNYIGVQYGAFDISYTPGPDYPNVYAYEKVYTQNHTINEIRFRFPNNENIDVEFDLILSEIEDDINTSLMPEYSTQEFIGNATLTINNDMFTMQGNNGYYTGSGIQYQSFTLQPGKYGLRIRTISGTNNFGIIINDNNYNASIHAYTDKNEYIELKEATTFNYAQIETPDINTNYDDVYELLLFEDVENQQEYDIFTIGEGTRPGNNLLIVINETHEEYSDGGTTYYGTITINNGEFNIDCVGGHSGWSYEKNNQFVLKAGTYTLSYTNVYEPSQYGNYNTFTLSYIENNEWVNKTVSKEEPTITFTLNADTTIEKYGVYVNFDNSYQPSKYTFQIMLNKGSTALPYEDIGQIPNPQILDFNVDEKTDIYYEQMPYSELNIDVDNTDGYFSDFTENSIVDNLNKECLIDFYLNVNNTGWCKAWTMQFDSLTADNQNARLTFKPYCISIINMEQIYDKNKQFLNSNGLWYMDDFASYMQSNYDIDLSQDETFGGAIILNYPNARSVKDLLLKFGAGLSNLENGQILAILDNKRMRYKLNTTIGQTYIGTITDNELLEKPLITKEELEGIVFTTRKVKSYSSTLTNWQKTISSVLKNTNDVLVVYGEEYNMVGVSANDITITGATLVSVDYIPYGGVAGNGSHYLVIEITGNVGDRYTLEINSNLAREEEVETQQQIYAKRSYETTDNFLKINSYEFGNSQYWIKLLDHLTKKIELEIKALPYLQVGDSFTLNDIGNVVVAEIHTSWSDGFKMKVIAYKVEYALYN